MSSHVDMVHGWAAQLPAITGRDVWHVGCPGSEAGGAPVS